MSHYLKKESNYLGAWDLWSDQEGNYFQIDVTITYVVDKQVKDLVGKKEGMFAYFSDTKLKPMLLNVTNRKVIFAVTKDKNIANWKNVPITIYVQQNISSPQGAVDGLRLKRTPLTQQQTKVDDQAIQDSILLLESCNNAEELKTTYLSLPNRNDPRVAAAKDSIKLKLSK